MDPAGLYEIHVDNDGDARENLTFQFRFTNRLANDNRGIKLNIGGPQVAVPLKNVGGVSAADNSALNFRESYQVTLVRGDRRRGNASPVTGANGGTVFGKPYDFVGTKTFGSVAGYKAYADSFIQTINVPGCNMPGRVFVGQRKEGFAVNLGRVFDLVNFVPVEGDSAPGAGDGGGFPGGITQSRANNQVDNANVTTIALELHKSCLTGSGNGVIGGWTSAVAAPGAPAESAADVLASGSGRRSVGAGLASRHAARQRAGHRPARQGSLQRQRAALRRPVRHLRDEPDAAGAARRAVPRRGQPDAGHQHSRISRLTTCRATTS